MISNINFMINLPIYKKLILKLFSPILNRIYSLKNLHIGELCYIFGDGVSLKWFDLASFSDKPSFALNKILFHKQAKYLNVKYNLFLEPYYFYPYHWDKDETTVNITGKKFFKNNIQKKLREIIKKQQSIIFFTSLSNYPVLRDSNVYYLYKIINDPNCAFLKECYLNDQNIFNGSFRCAIALAIYMGFKEITLVGCDYTHKVSRSHHWYEKGQGTINKISEYEKFFLNIANKYAKLITITLDGKSSFLPAQTYFEFTGKEPKFKENYDLMDKSMLDTLSKNPWYEKTIF